MNSVWILLGLIALPLVASTIYLSLGPDQRSQTGHTGDEPGKSIDAAGSDW